MRYLGSNPYSTLPFRNRLLAFLGGGDKMMKKVGFRDFCAEKLSESWSNVVLWRTGVQFGTTSTANPK